MRRFTFITDLHCAVSLSNRTGKSLDDLREKLKYVVDYTNSKDATLLIGGDVFDKSVVPYEAFGMIVDVLMGCYCKPICIKGNHDQLHRNDYNDKKTAFYSLVRSGVVESVEFTNVDFLSGRSGVTITNKLPLTDSIHPTILLYHGFLGRDDGRYSLRLQDIVLSNVPTLVLLGHDHTRYEPLKVSDNVTVHRPGSILRRDRTTQNQPPMFLDIIFDGEGFDVSYKEIPHREGEGLFHEQEGKSSYGSDSNYTDLIESLRNVSSDAYSLLDIVKQVSTPEVYDYIDNVLQEVKVTKVK